MKRKIERLPPVLESLEVRLVPSAATAGVTAAMVQAPPAILLPPGSAGSVPPALSPQRDAVFFNPLLSLGGGRRDALPHFPESGGVSERHLDNEQVRGLLDTGSPAGEDVDGEVFSGDLEAFGRSLASTAATSETLMQTAESLAARVNPSHTSLPKTVGEEDRG